MAKISDSKIELLRPDFSDSNVMLLKGMQELSNIYKPFEEAMKANFEYREDKATGDILQFINNNDANAPDFNEKLEAFKTNANAFSEGVSNTLLAQAVANRQVTKPEIDKSNLAVKTVQDQLDTNSALNKLTHLLNTDPDNAVKHTNDFYESMQNNATNSALAIAAQNLGITEAANTSNSPTLDLVKMLTGNELSNLVGNTALRNQANMNDVRKFGSQIPSPVSGGGSGNAEATNQVSSGSGSVASGSGKVKSFGANIDKDLSDTASKYGVDIKYLRGLLSMEGGTKGAMSPTGALGVGQFIKSTWNNLADTAEGKAIGMTKITNNNFRTANDPRKNNRINMLATGLLTKTNEKILKENGIPVTAQNLYIAHNNGPATVLAAYGKAPITKKMQADMARNGGKSSMSAKQFLDFQSSKYNNHYAKANGEAANNYESSQGINYIGEDGNIYSLPNVNPVDVPNILYDTADTVEDYTNNTLKTAINLAAGIQANVNDAGNIMPPKPITAIDANKKWSTAIKGVSDFNASNKKLVNDTQKIFSDGLVKTTSELQRFGNEMGNYNEALIDAKQQAANNVANSSRVSDVIKDSEGFKKWLDDEGLGSENFLTLNRDTQETILIAWQQYEFDIDNNNSKLANTKVEGGLSTAQREVKGKKTNESEFTDSFTKANEKLINKTYELIGGQKNLTSSQKSNFLKQSQQQLDLAYKFVIYNNNIFDGLLTIDDIVTSTIATSGKYNKWIKGHDSGKAGAPSTKGANGYSNVLDNPKKFQEMVGEDLVKIAKKKQGKATEVKKPNLEQLLGKSSIQGK